MPVPEPLPRPEGGPEPLTTGELLRYSWQNLGEVSPGLLYRCAQPDRGILEFLAERVNLRRVLNLRGSTDEHEQEVMAAVGGEVIQSRMSTRRPPTVRQILEMIRLTHISRERGESFLIHCRAGADRTSVMVAIWRILFQGVTDTGAIKRASILHRHFPPAVPMTFDTLNRFRPELFKPFVDDPSLLTDEGRKDELEERIAELEKRYFESQPLLSGTTEVTTGPLRAGAAKADLLEGWELPVQMASYGPWPGEATGVEEPVFARAVVLDNGSTRVAIVSCDLLIMDVALRQLVFERLESDGVRIDDLLLAATHTHTSIGGYVDHWLAELYICGKFDERIREHLADRVAEAIVDANESVRPARVGAGRTFVEGFSFNRRLGTTVDTEVGLVRIVDSEGEPVAVLVNYAAHPILEPSEGQLSSDYPGLLTKRLDERYGLGIFLNGALGDLNACAAGRAGEWHQEGLAEEVAQGLATVVEAAIDSIETHEEVELGSMTAMLRTPATNVNLIPDFLFPIEWWLAAAIDFPPYAPIQTVRVGDIAFIACSTEIGCRLGLQIKRRSPSPFPFVVSHANSYAGYAVTAVNHGKSKVDPTSLVALKGSTYGGRVVEEACDLLAAQWGERLDPKAKLLSPAATARLDEETKGLPEEERAQRREEAIRLEEEESLARADPTIPQTRRLDRNGTDSIPDWLRVEVSQLYLEDFRGGQRLEGRYRETRGVVRFRLPWKLDLAVAGGYVRSNWEDPAGNRDEDDGLMDLEFTLRRPFELVSDPEDGTALRVTPIVGTTAPTGKSSRNVPFAFSPAAGVWRPIAGGALELTWNTYRALSLDSVVTTAFDRHNGRRPGELWESALRYSERHGMVSFLLDLATTVQFRDRRSGGRQIVDVDETSFAFGIRPGISIHLGDHVEIIGQARFSIARSGDGIEEGEGGTVGLVLGF